MQDELPLVYRASLPSIHPWSLACFMPASCTCAGATLFWISGGGCSVQASPYIPQVQACRALLPESSRYSQSVSFDACRFRADVAVTVGPGPILSFAACERGCLALRFVTFFQFVSSLLTVHLSLLFLVASRLWLDSLQDALWTFEYR